ncbi:MAG: CinA family protein [Propionibacteriaceae bacterium]|jgi:nicotinamide-nucleotide amidase|nr:CinA family protein [Propionibacteriaceae bacterium]
MAEGVAGPPAIGPTGLLAAGSAQPTAAGVAGLIDPTEVIGPCGLPADVVAALIRGGQTVATAESLTGGLITACLTAVPGASQVVRGGLVVYSADLKTALAGVPAELIEAAGVVSAPVARRLAVGASRRCRADWGIGVTGVAGPGPSAGVAAGVVWLALAGPDGLTAERLALPGDRATVRAGVVVAACRALADRLEAIS